MDKIITISSFSKYVMENTEFEFSNQCGQKNVHKIFKPVESVGFPVKTLEVKEIEGLELDSDFNFLVVGQFGPRKNFSNLILWFAETFKDTENVGLVLKLSHLNSSTMDEFFMKEQIQGILSKVKDRKCPVYYVGGNLSDEEMNYLYTHPKIKALAHISHGEGYGIPLFEAAYNGMPVIAPAWSGYLDFMTYYKKQRTTKSDGKVKIKNKKKYCLAEVDFKIDKIPEQAVGGNIMTPTAKWCYPDRVSFQNKMKKVLCNYNFYKNRALELQETLLQDYSKEIIYDKFAELVCEKSLTNIDEWLASMEVEDV